LAANWGLQICCPPTDKASVTSPTIMLASRTLGGLLPRHPPLGVEQKLADRQLRWYQSCVVIGYAPRVLRFGWLLTTWADQSRFTDGDKSRRTAFASILTITDTSRQWWVPQGPLLEQILHQLRIRRSRQGRKGSVSREQRHR